MTQAEQAAAHTAIAAAMTQGLPAQQVTVSHTGATIITATAAAALRWRSRNFDFPLDVFVWRAVGVSA